jgi:C-terminal processing protease CtpA/Prc
MKLKILSDLKFSVFEKSVFLLLFCFIFSFSLTTNKILSEPTFYKKKISQADRIKDIDLLVEYLEHTYAGKFLYQKEYQGLKEALNKYKFESDKPITIWRFEKDLRWILRTFADGHLGVSRISHEKFRQKTSLQPKVISHEFKKINQKNILTIKIPTFLITDETEVVDTIELLNKSIKTTDFLIFDLSGNSGGFMSYPYQIAAVLWDEFYRNRKSIQFYPTPYKKEFRFMNSYSIKLFNKYHERNGLDEFQFFSNKASKDKLTDQIKTVYQLQDINTYFDFSKPIVIKAPIYPKHIFLVTDYSCASACEKFIEALEFHPRMTHLGNATQGSSQFSAIGWLQLPNSNLVVNIPTGAIEYYDNRKIEQIGYKPKLGITPGDNGLLETVYLYIEKNYK